MCSVKVLSGVLIYLYRTCCPICKQLYPGLPLKNSFQTTLYSFQKFYIISNQQYVIHIYYQKCYRAPTHFLVNTSFSVSLYKTKSFDHLIKANIPTLRCLHQSIDGSLELAYFVSILRIDKTFWLHHIQLFLKKPVKECRFDIHLPDLIIIKCCNSYHNSNRLKHRYG